MINNSWKYFFYLLVCQRVRKKVIICQLIWSLCEYKVKIIYKVLSESSKNRCAVINTGNSNEYPTYWISLSIGCLLVFNYYVVLEQLYEHYDSWQIQAMCLQQILCEAWWISYRNTWNALSGFWWTFFQLNAGSWVTHIFQGLSSVSSRWWMRVQDNQITSQMPENVGVEEKKNYDLENNHYTIHHFSHTTGISYGVCKEIPMENLNLHHIAAKFTPWPLIKNKKKKNTYLDCCVCSQVLFQQKW